MKTCPKCGSQNADSMNFCSECGADLNAIQQVQQPIVQENYQPYQQPAPVYSEPTPAYSQPAPTYSSPEAQKTNGLCIAGFILGLASIITLGSTSVLGIVLAVIGIIMASKKNNKGKGLAIAGIIISAIMLVVGTIFWYAIFTEIANNGGYSKNYSYSFGNYDDDDDKDKDNKSSSDIKKAIKKTSWIETDDSYLVFGSGSNFTYYLSKGDDDNYYEGTYDLYVGEDAYDYIVNDLSEYYVTDDELDDLIDRNDEYEMDNLICLVITNESWIVDGEEQLDEDLVTPYYGFYLEDDDEAVLDLVNMNSATYFTFTADD